MNRHSLYILLVSVFLSNYSFAQNTISVPFSNGFVGDNTANNVSSNSKYLSALGWTNVQFTQNSPQFVFVAQGNDIPGTVLITDNSGIQSSVPGFIKWRAPSGSNITTPVFVPTSGATLSTNSSNGSPTYVITTSSYIGLTFNGQTLTIPTTSTGGTTAGEVTGNAATTGILDALNAYLGSFPAISILDYTVNENVGTIVVTVTLSTTSTQTVTVNFITSNNTALSVSDYISQSGSLSFAPGQTSKTITLTIVDDLIYETTETFFVQLSNSVNASILDPSSTITINDNDLVSPTISTTINVTGTSSTLTITNAVQTAVDPLLTITADGSITSFTVSISGSYTTGDVLSYTGALPSGITAAAFNTTTKSLVFSGTTTASNWQTLLRTVTITTVSATCFQEQRQVSFVAGNKYYNNLNGHFYENVSGGINWANALTAAATKSYFGRVGYLVTMTSLAENNFIWKTLSSDSWMGASDNNAYINAATGTTTFAANTGTGSSDGKWYWVSGPEKGTLFSVGNGTPVTQSGQFAYWNPGEPNGGNGGEDCGQFYVGSGGRWNDLNFASNLSSFIVEYGGMSTDNVGANVVFTRNLLLSGAPSGTITGGNTTVCSSVNNTTLTLSGLVSGGTVAKWQYSYDDFLTAGTDIANTNTTYTVTNITQNTYYRAVVNTPSCTGLATSSTRIYVSTAVAGNIVADNNTICVNADVNFTLNGYSGTITKWQVSTSSTFASGITDIVNTTTAMSYQLTGAGTYYFRAVILSCSSTVYTAAYTVSCISGTSPIGGTISNSSFCNGTNSGTLTLSGYSGSITKWQYSIDGGVVWTDISNTANTYSYSGITVTRKFRALLTSGSCGTVWSAVGTVSVSNLAPTISYSISGAQLYVLNLPITNLVITNTGSAVLSGGYTISPALSTGLILGSDGSISGTPTLASAITTYTVTGTNACGTNAATVVIATGATPMISIFNNINKTYFDESFNIVAPTSNSIGAFSYTSSNNAVATIIGSTVSILGAGTTTIIANQAANGTYTSASINTLLTVSSVLAITKNGIITSTIPSYVNKNGALSSVFGLMSNGKIVAAKSIDGLTALSAGISALQIKTDFPSSTDGLYWIKNANINGGIAFQIYADMTTDGGGWTLVLNYLHQGGTNPALVVKTSSFPIQGSTAFGTDESASTTNWGHIAPATLNVMPFTQLRFYGKTSFHARIIHFKTTHANTIAYFKTGTGSMTGIAGSYTALTGHTANLPASTTDYFSNQGNIAMTNFPFWLNGNYHWGIKGLGNRWEVDDMSGNSAYHTFHQIWVR